MAQQHAPLEPSRAPAILSLVIVKPARDWRQLPPWAVSQCAYFQKCWIIPPTTISGTTTPRTEKKQYRRILRVPFLLPISVLNLSNSAFISR